MLTCHCVDAVQELEAKHTQLTEHNINLRVELDTVKAHLSTAESSLKSVAREHEIAVDDLDRRHRNESESLRQEGKRRMDDIITQHEDELRDLRRRFELEIEDERSLRLRELSQMTSQSGTGIEGEYKSVLPCPPHAGGRVRRRCSNNPIS